MPGRCGTIGFNDTRGEFAVNQRLFSPNTFLSRRGFYLFLLEFGGFSVLLESSSLHTCHALLCVLSERLNLPRTGCSLATTGLAGLRLDMVHAYPSVHKSCTLMLLRKVLVFISICKFLIFYGWIPGTFI